MDQRADEEEEGYRSPPHLSRLPDKSVAINVSA